MKTARVWLAGAALLGLSACGEDTTSVAPGEITLGWQVTARGCEAAGVDIVTVSLLGDRANADGQSRWEASCGSDGLTLDRLDAGRYRLVVQGIGESGRAEYEARTDYVEVRPSGRTELGELLLTARPATLEVRWHFGGPLCRQVDATTVEVRAFDDLGTDEAFASATCDDGRTSIELRPGEYTLAIHGLGPEEEIRFESIEDVVLGRGEEATIETKLDAL